MAKFVNLKDRNGNELKIHGSDVVKNTSGDLWSEEGAEINDTYIVTKDETSESTQYKMMKYVDGDMSKDPVQVGETINIVPGISYENII